MFCQEVSRIFGRQPRRADSGVSSDNHVETAAAKAGFSRATGYRLEGDPRLPSEKRKQRGSRRPDPLGGLFERVAAPLLERNLGLRAVAVFEELRRLHPELPASTRRTVERRVREWKAVHGPERADQRGDISTAARQPPDTLALTRSPSVPSFPLRSRTSRLDCRRGLILIVALQRASWPAPGGSPFERDPLLLKGFAEGDKRTSPMRLDGSECHVKPLGDLAIG